MTPNELADQFERKLGDDTMPSVWGLDPQSVRTIIAALRATGYVTERHPDAIIAKIIKDIRDRKGIGDVWDELDVDIRNEIAHEWRSYFDIEDRRA